MNVSSQRETAQHSMLCLVGEKLFSEELIHKAVQRIRPKLPQAAVIKSDGGERCASIRARFGVPTFSDKVMTWERT